MRRVEWIQLLLEPAKHFLPFDFFLEGVSFLDCRLAGMRNQHLAIYHLNSVLFFVQLLHLVIALVDDAVLLDW
jgi:hypothetical protein